MEPRLFLPVLLLMCKEQPQTLGGLRGNANKCEGKAPAVIIQRCSKHIKANVLCAGKVNVACVHEEMQILRWECVQRIQLGEKSDESATLSLSCLPPLPLKSPKGGFFHHTLLSCT